MASTSASSTRNILHASAGRAVVGKDHMITSALPIEQPAPGGVDATRSRIVSDLRTPLWQGLDRDGSLEVRTRLAPLYALDNPMPPALAGPFYPMM